MKCLMETAAGRGSEILRMKLLVDTHCWLWWFANDVRLGAEARAVLEDGENTVFFSAASSWEIAIKSGLGKLELPEAPERYVPKRLAE